MPTPGTQLQAKKSPTTPTVVPMAASPAAGPTDCKAKMRTAIMAVRSIGFAYMLGLLVVATFVASMPQRLASIPEAEEMVATRTGALATATRFHPERFTLNALLVPALDDDAIPLRWVDPRAAMVCRRAASVRVDGKPLVPGDLVPSVPFELEWHADACRPFGTSGPRFDGDVKLTVFREDWGFSAIVIPRDLRITLPSHRSRTMPAGVAGMPQFEPEDEPPGE